MSTPHLTKTEEPMAAQQTSRWRMPPRVEDAFSAELRTGRSDDPVEQRWAALERAHVLSQPWPLKHVRAHAAMIRLALHQRDARELVGQAVRLVVAGPASAVGRYPAGNTGRARVPATHPMPIAEDLAQLLEGRS
jgi:Protein of unknown function (DUF3703)